ncbi:50S ribosomal protein L9 [Clostridium sp. CAG:628]|nr:50S ribosomal protein L9 [Clostridium sp. CAG:628]
MKIILIDNVKGTGKKDEVKEVKDGYGSFLIKNRKAVLYSDRSKDILKTQIKEREDEEALLVKEMNEIKNKLEKDTLTFNVKTGDAGKVFGSISSKSISEELKKKGYSIDKKIINAENLNTLGTHIVKINLHKQVTAELNVVLKDGE